MQKWILIIEDDKVQCEVLCKHLALKRIEAQCAHTWADGVALSKAETFNLAIVDLSLPDSSQMQTAMRLHELNVPEIIAMTGMEDKELVRHCSRSKIPLIFKPISTREFMKDVLEALERQEPSDEIEEAIISTRNEPNEPDTTNATKVKSWLASNAIALLVAALIVLDHFAGWFGVFRGGAIDQWELRNQVTVNAKAIAEEKVARTEIVAELRNIHGENERSKAERDALRVELGEMHATINNIYTAMMKK